ncbi:hypothetical protein [Microcystis phage Mel-JY01]
MLSEIPHLTTLDGAKIILNPALENDKNLFDFPDWLNLNFVRDDSFYERNGLDEENALRWELYGQMTVFESYKIVRAILYRVSLYFLYKALRYFISHNTRDGRCTRVIIDNISVGKDIKYHSNGEVELSITVRYYYKISNWMSANAVTFDVVIPPVTNYNEITDLFNFFNCH